MVRRSGDSIRRIIPVSLSVGELAEMEDMVEAGELPKDYIDQYFDAVNANVYGEDAPRDRNGNRQEQGLGSPRNQTSQSIEAYKRWHKDEPGYADNLKRMDAELKATNERRALEAEKAAKTNKRRFVVQ